MKWRALDIMLELEAGEATSSESRRGALEVPETRGPRLPSSVCASALDRRSDAALPPVRASGDMPSDRPEAADRWLAGDVPVMGRDPPRLGGPESKKGWRSTARDKRRSCGFKILAKISNLSDQKCEY